MKQHPKKHIARYFTMLHGVKLPWLLILGSMVFSVTMMRTELQVATLTAGIIDASQSAIDGEKLLSYIGMVVLSAALSIGSSYFERKMEETINLRVRVALFRRILRLPIAYYDREGGDTLVSRVTDDAQAPASLFSMAVSFITCVATTVAAFLQLFDYNTLLATWSLLIIPITFLICLVYGKLMFRLGVFSTVTVAGSMGYLSERVRNFRLMKSALAEKLESRQGDKTFREMYKADFLSWLMVAGYQLAQGLFSILFIVIVFVIGGQLISTGEVTIGDLTGFYMITGIVGMQLMQFFMNVGSVSGTFGTMQKIAQILDTPAEAREGAPVPLVCSDIVFDNVSFSYQEGQPVLKNLSFRIPAGKVTAIIGGNGAGKSTVFKLLTRLYEPDSGEIRFADVPIHSLNLDQWRERFASVLQSQCLIGGTVRENLTYGLRRSVSREELERAARDANCCACILEKPEDFDADVGLGGCNFSGGQGQCISIARAMLRNADYLLLDEATSNLDAHSEAAVSQALRRLMKNRTTVMIAHNYAATIGADYIIVMQNGTVEAAGTPQELAETNEFYRLFSKTL